MSDSPERHKPWRQYLLEFIMMSLAVAMGFFAENLREGISEQKSAAVLAESLREDIRKDTAALHIAITFSKRKIRATENLLTLLHTPRSTWSDTAFYRNMVPLMTSSPFIPTDGTYTQMKASGTLQYFQQSLVNIMNNYATQLKRTTYRDEIEDRGTWIISPFNFDILNIEVANDIRFSKPITHKMYIKISERDKIDKLINLVEMIQVFRTRCLQEYIVQMDLAEKLIASLDKEYKPDTN